MAELADAQDLGSCAFGVQVQALLPAPKKREVKPFSLLAFSFALYLVYQIFSRFRKVSAITAHGVSVRLFSLYINRIFHVKIIHFEPIHMFILFGKGYRQRFLG